jgi:hypothetical protein
LGVLGVVVEERRVEGLPIHPILAALILAIGGTAFPPSSVAVLWAEEAADTMLPAILLVVEAGEAAMEIFGPGASLATSGMIGGAARECPMMFL